MRPPAGACATRAAGKSPCILCPVNQHGVVLVNGVSQGFGRASALAWGDRGMSVICADRDVALASKTAAEVEDHGGRAISIQSDATVPMDVQTAFRKSEELFGVPNGVVHAATRYSAAAAAELSEGEFHELIAETLFSTQLVMKQAARVMDSGWVIVIGPPSTSASPQTAMVEAGLASLTARYAEVHPHLRFNLVTPSRRASDPQHDARLTRTVAFLGSPDGEGVTGAHTHVALPPPPKTVEQQLPEIQAALDDRFRQEDDGWDNGGGLDPTERTFDGTVGSA